MRGTSGKAGKIMGQSVNEGNIREGRENPGIVSE